MKHFGRERSIEWVSTILVLSATLALSAAAANRRPVELNQSLDGISRVINGFSAIDNSALPESTLHALKASSYLSRTYRKPGNPDVDVFIAFYAEQRAGENMHSPKHCLPGSGWEIWDYATSQIEAGNHSYNVNRYSISREDQRMLVLYWYQSKGRIIASEYVGKALLAADTLMHQSTAGSIVRVIVPDQPGALEIGRSFAGRLLSEMERCFGV